MSGETLARNDDPGEECLPPRGVYKQKILKRDEIDDFNVCAETTCTSNRYLIKRGFKQTLSLCYGASAKVSANIHSNPQLGSNVSIL